MKRYRTTNYKLISVINGLGIVRCECRALDVDNELKGPTNVWYDVNLDEGDGDTVESFKTCKEAEKFASNY